MYVPSYARVHSVMGFGQALDSDTVALPLRFIKALMQIAASTEDFDETLYLGEHKDVAEAVSIGAFNSGRHHYLTVGYFEGRRNPSVVFDDAWYAVQYPDAQDALLTGRVSSLLDHYIKSGAQKGYAPNPHAFEQLQQWQLVF